MTSQMLRNNINSDDSNHFASKLHYNIFGHLNLPNMRKLPGIILSVLGSLIFLQSCQKEVGFEDSNSAVTGDFKCKINSAQWVANSIAGASRIGGFINITGRSNDKKYITITLTDSGVHNYTLDDMSFNAAAYIDSTL